MFQAQISEDGEDGRWFMVFSCCCLRIVYCLFCACVCVCESSGYVLLALWRIIVALSSGTAKGTQCNASLGPQLSTHTYICGRDASSPTCITIKVRLWASGLAVSVAHDDEVAAYFQTVHSSMKSGCLQTTASLSGSLAQHPRLHPMHLNKCYNGSLNGFYRPSDHKSCSAW